MEAQPSSINRLSFFLTCGIPIFCIFAYGSVHQPILALFYVLVVLLVLLWIGDAIINGSTRLSASTLQLPLLLFGFYGFIQTIPFGSVRDFVTDLYVGRTISLEPYATQMTALHIIFLCIYFAACLASISGASRIRRMMAVIVAFGLLYSFYAIIQSILSPSKIFGIYEPGSATPFGSFVNRHNFAAIIEMTIAIPMAMLFTGSVEKHKTMLYWVAIGLMTTALLLSGSRGGLVSLLIGSVFLALMTIRVNERSGMILSGVLAATLFIFALVGAVFVGGDTSLTRLTDAAANTDLTSNRTEIWGVTLHAIRENLPLGAGIGAFPQAYTKFDPASGAQRVEQAHNDYLQVAADAGLVGVALGALFLYLFFRVGLQSIKNTDPELRAAALGAFTGCFTILIHSLFDFVLHITAVSLMFLMLLAMLVSSGRRSRNAGDAVRIDAPAPRPASVAKIRS